MWRPDDWPKNPCDNCQDKQEDKYGLLCLWSCGEGMAWLNKEAGADAILGALKKESNRLTPTSDWWLVSIPDIDN